MLDISTITEVPSQFSQIYPVQCAFEIRPPHYSDPAFWEAETLGVAASILGIPLLDQKYSDIVINSRELQYPWCARVDNRLYLVPGVLFGNEEVWYGNGDYAVLVHRFGGDSKNLNQAILWVPYGDVARITEELNTGYKNACLRRLEGSANTDYINRYPIQYGFVLEPWHLGLDTMPSLEDLSVEYDILGVKEKGTVLCVICSCDGKTVLAHLPRGVARFMSEGPYIRGEYQNISLSVGYNTYSGKFDTYWLGG